MTEWISDKSDVVDWIMNQIEIKDENPPVLVLKIMKLYKIKLLENPKKIEGTDEGYMVKVKNFANHKEYILFLQRTLASKFKKVHAKAGDILAVINKGKNMQTGYDYTVARWRNKFNAFLIKKHQLRENSK